MMKYAIENQLVKNEGFARWIQAEDTPVGSSCIAPKCTTSDQNDYAHGNYSLTPTSLWHH